MKIITLTAMMLLLTALAFGQLKIIEIKGRVSQRGGRYLVVGNVINDSAQIKFTNFRDEVKAIDKNGKTYRLTPHQRSHIGAQVVTANDLDLNRTDQAEVKLPFIPVQEGIQRIPKEMQSDRPIIIQNINRYLFDTDQFYPGPKSSFVLKSNHSQKALKVSGDTLIIRYEDFLDSAVVEENYSLYFDKGGDSKLLVVFKPFFDLTNQSGAMISSIVKYFKSRRDRDSLYAYCLSQVNQAFGKPSSLNFQQQFNKFYKGDYDTTLVPTQHGIKVPRRRSGVIIPHNKPAASAPIVEDTKPHSLRQFAPYPGNQGSSGSCVAWASAYGAYSITFNMRHPGPHHAFSPEFIYNQISPDEQKCLSGRYGISVDSAMALMTKEGNLPKNDLFFNCSQQIQNTDIQAAKPYKITLEHPLFSFTAAPLKQEDVEIIKYNVGQLKKPVMIAIFLPERKVVDGRTFLTSFDSLEYAPNTGIWQPSPNDYLELQNRADTSLSSHEMCVVGYNDNINGGSFEVLNSWGEGWGVGGYLWLNYEDFKKFGIDAYVIDGLIGDSDATVETSTPNKHKGKQVTQNKPVHEK